MGYVIDKIRRKEEGADSWSELDVAFNADNIYYKDSIEVEENGETVIKDDFIPLSVIAKNYLDFTKNFDGFVVTSNEKPTNSRAKVWIDFGSSDNMTGMTKSIEAT
jgi:hypothetical protein